MFKSLKSKFIISFLSVEIVFLLLISLLNFNAMEKASNTLTDEKIDISSKLVTEIIKVPLITYDLATIDDALFNFSTINNVLGVRVETTEHIVLSSHTKKGYLDKQEFDNIINTKNRIHKHNNYTYIYNRTIVIVDNKKLGYVHLVFNASKNYNAINDTKQLTYILIAFALIIGYFIAYAIGNNLGVSIKKLIKISKQVSNNEDVKIPYNKNRNDEVGILFNSMHNMQNIINNRTSELKNSLNELEHFIEALNVSSIVSKTDSEGVITFVNSKFLEVNGYSEEELIGQTHGILRDPEKEDSFYENMWKVITSKQIFHNTFKNIKKNGEAYYVDATIVPLLDSEDNIREYICISYEVTEIIDAKDKALEAKKVKENFLANMSHEIRTPMNAIIGFTDILKNNLKENKNIKYINIIKDSSNSLLHIINDILDFSKIESGKLSINKHPFSPKEEFKKDMDLFSISTKEKDIDLIVNLSDNLPKCLNGDKFRIEQILNNFLSNALKFTDNGKKIYIDIDYDNKKSILNITVKDEGIGIPKDVQDKIFNAFEQADGSTTRKFGGTGLGLSISNKLAHLMDGYVSLVSEENKGSSFSLHIPLQECNEGIIEHKEDSVETKKQLFGKILVAEDNKTNQVLIKLILEEYKLDVEIVNDGLEAVKAFKTSKYDLVLMDENMPNMTGLEAYQEIRKYEEQNNLQKTPVIALTANVLEDDKNKFLKAGMDGYLSKPIDNVQLESVLNNFL